MQVYIVYDEKVYEGGDVDQNPVAVLLEKPQDGVKYVESPLFGAYTDWLERKRDEQARDEIETKLTQEERDFVGIRPDDITIRSDFATAARGEPVFVAIDLRNSAHAGEQGATGSRTIGSIIGAFTNREAAIVSGTVKPETFVLGRSAEENRRIGILNKLSGPAMNRVLSILEKKHEPA